MQCRVVTWFYSACGAFARDPNGPYGGDWGRTKGQAASKAKAICERYGGTACVIETTVCSR